MANQQENIRDVKRCLTNYDQFKMPLFKPGFLAEKWPVIDFYVELLGSATSNFFFFIQAKSTMRPLPLTATHIRISSRKRDVHGLMKSPGPTYLFAVHEPSSRVFVKYVHSQTPIKRITIIPVANELTAPRLKELHDEVSLFWKDKAFKPAHSSFL